MTRLRRLRAIFATLLKVLAGLIVALLVLIGAGLAVIETGWGKNWIRGLLVRQANQYLTATLQIGRLEGSLLRGIRLGDVSVSRDGKALIHIDEIALAYSVRELLQQGVVIRSVRLTRPVIVGGRQADGRWDLAALVKRESREQERTGPARPIEVQSIEIFDGRISLRDPLDFGAAHVPTEFEKLNAAFRFAYFPVRWTLTFDRVSWIGRAPDLSVNSLTGALGHGPGGWFFERFSVATPRSAFTLAGRVNRDRHPTELDLSVNAGRFAFQEWSGVLRGLKNIAIEASFDTSLKGPVDALATELRMAGSGGLVSGRFTLNTTVPGWHGAGAVDVGRLNLARWLNRSDRPSDITGHVTFDLALELGRRFPRGVYTFAGPHVMYMNYVGDNLRARGQITASSVLIADATALAYGASVRTTDGTIGIAAPFPFRFQGTAANVDLRLVPQNVPVPHVDSILAFEYDVTGRFNDPFITGRATFADSRFLGAVVRAGTIGSVDTSQKPLRYSGEGDLGDLNLHRFGEGLDVGWLRDPRYAGTLAGRFHVDGTGTDAATMVLTGGGRITRAELFKGILSDGDVSIEIRDGTVRGSYNGELAGIDPAVPFEDPRFDAALSGSGRVTVIARDLLTRDTTLADYDVEGALTLRPSTVRTLHVDRGQLEASLSNSTLRISRMELTGPEFDGTANGTLSLAGDTTFDVTYDLTRVDLARVRSITGQDLAGVMATKGRATGPFGALRLAGDASVMQLNAFDVRATTLGGTYDVTIPSGDFLKSTGRVEGRGSFLTILRQALQQASGTVTYDAGRVGFDLALTQKEGYSGTIAGNAVVDANRREATIGDLTFGFGSSMWRLVPQTPPPVVTWNDAGLAVTQVEFVDGREGERIRAAGTWRYDGAGALRVTATHVFLDTLLTAFAQPTRYGGVMDLDATISGTREDPRVKATLTVASGRVERVTYQQLTGRLDYTDQTLAIDMRLDQAPGIWITAVGTLPLALFETDGPERPIDVAIKSSGIDLGLLEGLTGVVRAVSGQLNVDVAAVGTTRDPHFTGTVTVANAAFAVAATGAQYKNGRAALTLTPDRVAVDTLHLEDSNARPLDVHGSLGTHELRVGDLEIEVTTRRFEVLHNELGRMEVDAALRLRGRYEAPRLTGTLTISSGNIQVDEILQRTLFQPYATEETQFSDVDPVAAINPWNRLGLDIFLRVPNSLRLVGENVQISEGTPIGLGDINLRVLGDLYLYKDPGTPMSVTGSFDQVSGTYSFQGRRFDVDPASSINFKGDFNPEVYVTVTRVISGVQTRVSIFGPLQQPELRLASSPPLDESDILSLIVFNTSTNLLSSSQQQELMVRAGTLAAGFIATPIVTAIENETGIDLLELEPGGDFGAGPRLTVGQEIAPGLVARFSRQFGLEAYDEATVEYYLSRFLRLRGTFSDAQSLTSRSPFRRVERAGVDLLVFFSF